MTRTEDKSIGALLGTTCGDILGSKVEGMEAQVIAGTVGKVENFPDEESMYTDDTQMTIALADSLVEVGHISLENVAAKYSDYFQPHRGYADAALTSLNALTRGMSWKYTGRVAHREGSFGNGGSMRIAPIGIAYRNASDDVLRKAVIDALLCTHVHPQAVDAAFVQAKAIATLVKTEPSAFGGPLPLLETLLTSARDAVIRSAIQRVINQVKQYEKNANFDPASSDDVIGNGVTAADAIGSSLLSFSRFWQHPEKAIIHAVSLGGDTDTIAAHTGALVGALHGREWIPRRWFERIENRKQGRDFIVEVGVKLAHLDVTTSEGEGERILKEQEEWIAKGGEFEFETERNNHVQQLLTRINSKLSLQRSESKEKQQLLAAAAVAKEKLGAKERGEGV